MRSLRIMCAIAVLAGTILSPASAAEQTLFGPAKYDVKERYGKPNQYTGTFTAGEGLYLLKLQNGDTLRERSEYIEVTVNGEKVLRDGKYAYAFIAGFLNLRKESTIEVVLKDERPSGFRRPALPPRNVTITVLPVPPAMKKLKGVFGLNAWEDLAKHAEAVLKIKHAEGPSLAMAAGSLQNDTSARAEALRKLSDLKDRSAQEFLLRTFSDVNCIGDVRGEAALALGAQGDKAVIPVLMPGILEPKDKLSAGSARALSFFPEEETRAQLEKTLERLDTMRRDAVIRSIIDAGWRPVSTVLKLAASSDPHVANTATKLLGGMQDPRATDLLLSFVAEPGQRDLTIVITALGETKDPRAVEPLVAIATDRAKRKGRQVELGEALANLGDQRGAEPLADMIRYAESRQQWERLKASYKKLTGKDFSSK